MMPNFHEVRFTISSKDMQPRLKELIAWLDDQLHRTAAALAKCNDIKVERTAAGVPVRSKESAERDSLAVRLAQLEDDHELARCWLAECGVEQTWTIGIELARWINRPILALSTPQG